MYSLVSSLSYTGYITNLQSDQLPVVVIAQLVEHMTHIAEFMGANLIQA